MHVILVEMTLVLTGDEPRRLDLVLIPEFQETVNTHGGAKHTPRYVRWICRRPVLGVDPTP